MRSWSFVLGSVVVLGACRSTAPAPAPPGTLVAVQEVVRAPAPMASDTSARARAIREGQRRAAEAAARVVAISVAPQRLAMNVGGTLPLSALQVDARDAAGRRVEDFAPTFSVQDNAMISLRGGVITALEPGTTNLRISAMTVPTNSAAPPPLTVLVPITISAATMRSTVTRPLPSIDSMVPVELVRYLLGNARIVAFQPIEVLDSTTLRGAYVHGSRFGAGGGATVASYPWTRRMTLDSIRNRLAMVGWGPMPTPRTAAEQPGFQGSNLVIGGGSSAFCRNREMLVVNVSEARGTETVVSFMHQGSQTRNACDPDPARAMAMGATNLIPSLTPVPDESVISRGRGGGNDEGFSEALIQGVLPVDEVLEHYARQLTAAGWTPVARAGVPGIAIATYTLRDSTARTWGGVLTVLATPGSNRTDLRIVVRHTP